MFLSIGIDTENVAHVQKEYYSAIKNNDFRKFTGKWMDLEKGQETAQFYYCT